MSDESWIHAALAKHERALVAYAVRLTGDLERARDIVQETFLELCDRPRGEVEPRLAAWLFTVCRHRALDLRNKESRMLADGIGARPEGRMEGTGGRNGADTADPSRRLEERDASARVLRALDALPPRERECLRLKFGSGFAYREIAEITGLSVTNVGFLIHRGLKSLRSQLEPLRLDEVTS